MLSVCEDKLCYPMLTFYFIYLYCRRDWALLQNMGFSIEKPTVLSGRQRQMLQMLLVGWLCVSQCCNLIPMQQMGVMWKLKKVQWFGTFVMQTMILEIGRYDSMGGWIYEGLHLNPRFLMLNLSHVVSKVVNCIFWAVTELLVLLIALIQNPRIVLKSWIILLRFIPLVRSPSG